MVKYAKETLNCICTKTLNHTHQQFRTKSFKKRFLFCFMPSLIKNVKSRNGENTKELTECYVYGVEVGLR